MKKGFVLLFSLLVFGLIMGGTMWRNANSFAQYPTLEIPPDDGDSGIWKSNLIDDKALQAKDNEESAVRALADEVFSIPEFAYIPTEDREAMKERVLNAELNYRSGQSEGIAEENIVLTVNELADKLNAPDYARTSAMQVRVLRAGLLNKYPNFIAQETIGGESGTKGAQGDSVSPDSYGTISSTMSPLESVYVTALMLEQKIINENYQYAPQEWADKVYNDTITNWQADQAGNSGGEPSGEQAQSTLTAPENEKRTQMVQTIMTGAQTLFLESQNSSASPNIYNATLDTLGIEQ